MKKLVSQLVKYGFTMIISQIIIIAFMYISVDVFNLNEKISYAIILTLVYIGVYLSYLNFVFKKDHSKEVLFRFSHILIFSWVANNLLFSFLTDNLDIHYVLASILNTVLLGGVRFALNKYYVFK
ncbi:MAG: hypothetical protein KBD26_00955 [Candidatus Pacebacteria bacterium]|nr:hypothetical protein [Candidatus Paceibacterota bacterium]